MITINVKVIPGSSRDAVVGLLGGNLKVKVSAPPEGGRANKSLAKILAKWLEISPDKVLIKSGHQSQRKIVEIHSVKPEQYEAKISQL
jgi:uncharacterized protein